MESIWRFGSLMLRANTRGLPFSGPQLKLNGPTIRENSSTWTIPSTVSVGDYLVIACNNSCTITNDNAQGGYGWSENLGRYVQSTYLSATRIFIKVATSEDINTSYTLNANGFAFIAHAYVFTNPNQTGRDYSLQPSGYSFSTQYWTSKTGSIVFPIENSTKSQHTFPAAPNIYGPNCLRLFIAQSFPDNGPAPIGVSWSSGVNGRTSNDGFWWMALGSAFIPNATGLETPTIFFSQGGAISWQSIYLP
jgi:hypothetical protein